MATLHLSRLHFPVTALGPGRRIGLWVQGCYIRCPGCISVDTWAPNKGAVTTAIVSKAILAWLGRADGLTISGGEPLDQGDALENLLNDIRPRLAGDVLLYTGYPESAALDHPLIRSGLIDAVIPEPYELAAPQTTALRGSDNQPLIALTRLGRERYEHLLDAPPDRTLDVMIDKTGVWFAGIPGPGDFALLETALRAKGHRLATSADARALPDKD